VKKGTDYVIVSPTKVDTNQLIPALQKRPNGFNTYGLDQNGLFFNSKTKSVTYNYGLILNFNKLISHQSRLKKNSSRKKTNQRWFKTLLDSRGNIVKTV
jgi:hypothetical protein